MPENNLITVSASVIEQVKPLNSETISVIYKSGFEVKAIKVLLVGSRMLIYTE